MPPVRKVCGTLDRTISGQDLYSVLSPVTWFCRIFGSFPFVLKGYVGKRKYSMSYVSIIYSLIVLVLTLIGLFTWTKHTEERVRRLTYNIIILLITIRLQLITEIFSMLIIIVAAILSKDKFANAIDSLSLRDVMLRKLGTTIDYTADLKRINIRLGIIILIIVMLHIYDFTYEIEFNFKYPLDWLAWVYPKIVRIANAWLFIDILFILEQRFAALNEHLTKLIEETKDSLSQTISTSDNMCERIRSIAAIHGTLCEIAVSVNQMFGFNIMVGVIYALLILTSLIHYIVQEMNDPNWSYLRILGSLNWGVNGTMQIVCIVTACHLTQSQASRTGKLIHKLQIHGVDTQLNNVIQSFSLQLHHEKIEFSCVGLFPLDATLIQSMVGVVTTYIVIILQFETSTTPEMRSNEANNSFA